MSAKEKNKRNKYKRNRYSKMSKEQKNKKKRICKKQVLRRDKGMLITFFFIKIVNNVNKVNIREQCIIEQSGRLSQFS